MNVISWNCVVHNHFTVQYGPVLIHGRNSVSYSSKKEGRREVKRKESKENPTEHQYLKGK